MFLRGFERDGAKTSDFFKLQKSRTDKNIVIYFSFYLFFINKEIFDILAKKSVNKINVN